MIASTVTISAWASTYVERRKLPPRTAVFYRDAAAGIERWAGHVLPLASCDANAVELWCQDRLATVSAGTVRSQRGAVLSMLREAWRAGLIDSPPKSERWKSPPAKPVHAYTVPEMRALLDSTSQMPRRMACVWIPEKIWWRAMLLLAWDTAARRHDLLTMEWGDVCRTNDGSVVAWRQAKTGRVQRARLRPETVAALDECRSACRLAALKRWLLPWPYRHEQLTHGFVRLKKLAGVTRGSLKWVRRASATNVESQQRGAGRLQLGHRSQGVAEASYLDQSQLPPDWPVPEAIG